MRRVRSKGKKLSATNQDDPMSDEEKIPTQKRRGRPHKTVKDETEEDIAAEKDEDSEETTNGSSKDKDSKTNPIGKKRKDNGDTKDENLPGDEDMSKSKQTRHRRKGKPCRAPEAVVECT